jgi:uncharacterized protein (TIGR02117 family)
MAQPSLYTVKYTVKRTIKTAAVGALLLLLLCCCAVLATFFLPMEWFVAPPEECSKQSTLPALTSNTPHQSTTATESSATLYATLYIAQYLYHTGLVFPVKVVFSAQPSMRDNYAATDDTTFDTTFHNMPNIIWDWSEEFPELRGCEFVEVGWGDRAFYMGGTVTASMALEALFASRSSAVGLVGLPAPPLFTQPERLKTIRLSPQAYICLVNYVRRAFERSTDGKPIFLREGFWGKHSSFYAGNNTATGRYSLLNNCNVWAARGLNRSGVRVPLWAGLPHPLMWMIEESPAYVLPPPQKSAPNKN